MSPPPISAAAHAALNVYHVAVGPFAGDSIAVRGVFGWGYVLKVLYCVVAPVAILVVDLSVLQRRRGPQKCSGNELMDRCFAVPVWAFACTYMCDAVAVTPCVSL